MFSLGKGNNHPLVNVMLESREPLTLNQNIFWKFSQFCWTQNQLHTSKYQNSQLSHFKIAKSDFVLATWGLDSINILNPKDNGDSEDSSTIEPDEKTQDFSENDNKGLSGLENIVSKVAQEDVDLFAENFLIQKEPHLSSKDNSKVNKQDKENEELSCDSGAQLSAKSSESGFLGQSQKLFYGKNNTQSNLKKENLIKKMQQIKKSQKQQQSLKTFKTIPSSKKVLKNPHNSKVNIHENKLDLLQDLVHVLLKKQNLFSFFDKDLEYQLTDLLLQRENLLKFKRHKLKIANHLTGAKHLCVKHLLTENMKEYEVKTGQPIFRYMPYTVKFDEESYSKQMEKLNDKINETEDEEFMKNTEKGQIVDLRLKCSEEMECDKKLTVPWILKPGEFTNRGRGISMGFTKTQIFNRIRKEFDPEYQKKQENITDDQHEAQEGYRAFGDNVFLVQKYITSPLLYKKRKFDIRCFVLIVRYNSQLFAYFFKQGYARTSSYDYSTTNEDNLLVHLTNEAVQIKGEVLLGVFFNLYP